MIIAIIILLIIIGGYFCLYRNNQTYKFSIDIVHNLVFTGDNWYEKYNIWKRVSYEKMVFSFKPLKLESFYTAEEIEILTKKEENLDLAK